ncbi:MAG: serine/threonine protein kinase [Gammaproteobacteria bacterium]|nr:serine/threonine protein kinase [Gammaproteobacteria bacterium]
MRYSGVDWIDSQMFRLATYLLPQPAQVNEIEIISYPENLSSDPESLNQLTWLISKLAKSNASAIGLLMEPLPSLDYQPVDMAKADSTSDAKWQASQTSLSHLAQVLAKHNVQLGIIASGRTDYYSVGNLKTELSDIPDVIRQVSGVLLPQPEDLSIYSIDNNFPYQRLPVTSNYLTARQPLIWQEPGSNITIPDTTLGLFARYKKSDKVIWYEEGFVELDYERIKTDISGHVMMYYSMFTGHSINASFISLDQALKASGKKFKNKLVLIGRENDPAVLSLANHLASLISQSYYHVPIWAYGLSYILLFLVMFYLFKFVSRIGRNTAYVTSLLLITVVLVFQYGLFITKGFWTPFVMIYFYLILGHIVVLIKQHNDHSVNHLRLQAHEALWHLGQYQFEQGDHDKALYSLLKCKPTEDVLEKMYEIGLGFERRREYDKALQLYSEINIRHKGFKDVAKRLESLTNVSGVATEVVTAPGSITKTLVMPDLGLQLPVLGRYELEKELGRGAMGVVYLGKDPKINRQVAIKTLEYNMFSEAEIKTIKSRFFREAEAAGRLSHPNIVTVYDVGDEKDFAFIAMDYAQGVPLSVYAEKDNLLPVAEVYKIIADVADTLDYAHQQNIVHRDIKPSNIMYNPETGQVKITDFGIARITDSAKTRTGSFMGSPAYMAPEQMTGSRVDGQADIYALGTSFYQLLTGELPYKADSLASLTYQITHNKHRPIRDLRADLPSSATRIVNKALQKNPEKRYLSGKDMAAALRKGMP